jgi:hypothetical protein
MMMKLRRIIFSRENMFALALCLMVVLMIIVTADATPEWIYQGF